MASKREDIVESLTDMMVSLSVGDRQSIIETQRRLASVDEGKLLEAITTGLPRKFWDTYRSLKESAERSELSDEEADALASMADTIEEADTNRLTAVAELAELRQVPFDELVAEFEIGFTPR